MMSHLRRAGLVASLASLALLVTGIVGCEGKRGPEGPAGPTGPSGESTRTVMSGTVPADDGDYFISLPGFDLDDPALVSVFVNFVVDVEEYDELPLVVPYEDGTSDLLYASITEGGITLYGCAGLDYILIIIE
jgi:hypothetical protein